IAHGFSTKSRARSFTLLDQRSNTAVSMNREALYAGLAPSELNFSSETAVYPIWPETGEFDSGAVDWTDRQTLSGWLRSRTRTQFLTVAHRDERGRLQVSPASDGRVHIENGLEWDLEALIVCDAAGDLYFGEAIDAGASTELIPLTDEKRSEFVDLLKQHPLVAPHTSGNASGFFDWNYRVTYMYGGTVPVRYDANL